MPGPTSNCAKYYCISKAIFIKVCVMNVKFNMTKSLVVMCPSTDKMETDEIFLLSCITATDAESKVQLAVSCVTRLLNQLKWYSIS